MDNKTRFEREYLCKWITNESYNKAYELWVKYYYECERWDEFVCTGGRDKDGFIKPANGQEYSIINSFAFKKRNEIMILAREYGIPHKKMNRAKEDVCRLTLDGLVREYNIIYQKEEK